MIHSGRRAGASLLLVAMGAGGVAAPVHATVPPDGRAADAVTAWTIDQLEDAGYVVDHDCVRGLVDQLNDGDLDLLATAAANDDSDAPELSPEGEALGDQMAGCFQATSSESVQALVDVVLASEDGADLDRECVTGVIGMLPPALVDELLAATTSSVPLDTSGGTAPIATGLPELDGTEALLMLLSCEPGASSSVSVSSSLPVAHAIDPCRLLDADQLATVFDDLDAGVAGPLDGPFGAGVACTWSNDRSMRVQVIITGPADIDAWAAEAADGDAVADGEAVDGIGDRAFISRGELWFSSGETLVGVDIFPAFDVTPEMLEDLARSIADRIEVYPAIRSVTVG